MSDRKMFRWTVKLQSETGSVSEREVNAFWSPTHDLTEQSVSDAARIAAHDETGKNHHVLSVELAA